VRNLANKIHLLKLLFVVNYKKLNAILEDLEFEVRKLYSI